MQGFETFRLERRKDLRRIARATNGEMEADELLSEAFFLTMEIEEKMNRMLDLTLASDQSILLGWLYARFVRYADKTMQYSIKLDAGWDDDTGELTTGAKLSSQLAAPETEDPLTRQVMAEDHQQQLETVQASYSEASAYTLLLIEWSWDFKGLAAHLLLGCTKTLRNRVALAAEKQRCQPSLFDGIEHIDPRFRPTRSRGTNRAMKVLRDWFSRWRSIAAHC
ncbi:hypothetical protein ABQJ54_16150 [Rhodanobacter sp. Si-c]|uniref:Sigma-70 family RNA polymerase sigma factor n=1 Tax=Rhodanobacter lycopersici TaxID=3162487 RepID=A0ABV3QIC1_9GAMM